MRVHRTSYRKCSRFCTEEYTGSIVSLPILRCEKCGYAALSEIGEFVYNTSDKAGYREMKYSNLVKSMLREGVMI